MKKLLYLLLFINFLNANERIITLSPAINEIAFALGLGDKIIANTEFCDFPIESKNIQKVGGYGSVSLEKVVNLNPTIILNQDYDKKLNQSLKDLNFKTLVYKTNSLEDIKFTIKDLGEVFNKKEEAKDLNNQIENSLESLKNIIENQKILIVISPQSTLSNQIFVVGNFIYFEDIIKASNNINAYQSTLKSQPSINSEKLITLNPDIIILNSGDAQLGDGSSILMTKEEVLATHKVAPKAKIIAVHMEAVNHSALSRDELKEYSKQKGMEDFVFIPKDGESLQF